VFRACAPLSDACEVPPPTKSTPAATPPLPRRVELELESALGRHPTRRFIEVPYSEKDEAKQLGALWEPTCKKWYVPVGLNRKLFRWADALIPKEFCAVQFPSDKPRKKPRRKKNYSADRSTIYNGQIPKALDDKLNFLLDKPN
jgi:hypothetical protein